MRQDPHNEFTGRNILFQAHSVEETANISSRPPEEVRTALESAAEKLFAVRSKRVRPHLDDKILTAWNGLMISAFAKGGAILSEPRYAAAAERAADFILSRMYDAKTGVLLRRYRQQDAAIPGFLDDYAFFTQALLDLYETQFDLRHFETAVKLTEKQIELFEDREHGGFFSTAAGDATLVMRMKDDYDGAEPSGNSVAREPAAPGADDRPQGFSGCRRAVLRAFASRIMALVGGAADAGGVSNSACPSRSRSSWWAIAALLKPARCEHPQRAFRAQPYRDADRYRARAQIAHGVSSGGRDHDAHRRQNHRVRL